MSYLEAHNTPSLAEMWQFIDKNLGPIGMTPDKAMLDHIQVYRLYLEIRNLDNIFRDTIQIQVLKNNLAFSLLSALTN